jgi:GDP-D-mannose dehydratase
MAHEDSRCVFKAIKVVLPDEVYFFAGQSSVGEVVDGGQRQRI